MHLLIPIVSKCMCENYIYLMIPIKMIAVATSTERSDLSSDVPFFFKEIILYSAVHKHWLLSHPFRFKLRSSFSRCREMLKSGLWFPYFYAILMGFRALTLEAQKKLLFLFHFITKKIFINWIMHLVLKNVIKNWCSI